jgi:hypothetical protein
MFDVLRQAHFSGEFLELGGGYSTVLASNMFDMNKVKLTSIDLNPDKYNHILNSIASRKVFLSKINNIEKLTVSLKDVFAGLEGLRLKLATFDPQDVKNVLSKYVTVSDGACDQITNFIFSENGDGLRHLITTHPGYLEDLKFYQSSNYETCPGYCASLINSGYVADAVFFDCGEISSVGEWSLMEDVIKVGGYALFHDVYYPKSIKNFLIVVYIELSNNWKLVYRDVISPQGGVVAIKVGSNDRKLEQ